MQRVLFFTVVVLALHGCVVTREESPYYGFNHQKLGKVAIESVQCRGPLTLEGTEVLVDLQVDGILKAEGAFIQTFSVTGEAELKNCVVANSAFVDGFLSAAGCSFQGTLSITGGDVELLGCTLDSLTVRADPEEPSFLFIDLRGGTKVSGRIIVEADCAEVWVSPDSEITGEQVVGAEIHIQE